VAGTSLLTLIDDIASVLDDVSVMTKVAAKKTAGVLGDDLALNAQQVAGVRAERELPVVLAVAKGSMINKVMLVPAALLISAVAPWLITPLLMLGGAYLCYEGFEKLAHRFMSDKDSIKARHSQHVEALAREDVDMVAFERDKIKGAIRTDFILSAEIIVIALGTVAAAAFAERVVVLIGIAVIMTIGVYGLVAGIVKLDDVGVYLLRNDAPGVFAALQRRIGRLLLATAPKLMKALSVVGTAAMFMVGGGILTHGIHAAHDVIHGIAGSAQNVAFAGPLLAAIAPTILNAMAGIVAGALVLAAVSVISRIISSTSG
jgi:predicted DNA repair protein MutK